MNSSKNIVGRKLKESPFEVYIEILNSWRDFQVDFVWIYKLLKSINNLQYAESPFRTWEIVRSIFSSSQNTMSICQPIEIEGEKTGKTEK